MNPVDLFVSLFALALYCVLWVLFAPFVWLYKVITNDKPQRPL